MAEVLPLFPDLPPPPVAKRRARIAHAAQSPLPCAPPRAVAAAAPPAVTWQPPPVVRDRCEWRDAIYWAMRAASATDEAERARCHEMSALALLALLPAIDATRRRR